MCDIISCQLTNNVKTFIGVVPLIRPHPLNKAPPPKETSVDKKNATAV